ncbi:UNVERIFIED_CONTAM: hypothetical protein HDU68_007759 [Siphonaria sp. JEL0065]|nr:hypothetical protein HDU68_007759 [Siphonaria sp. JEL0065]
MTIEDLRIEPKLDHPTNYVHGLLGITPKLSLEGSLKFTLAKAKPISSIKLLFTGSIACALRSPSIDNNALFKEEKVLISRPIELSYDPKDLASAGDKEIPFTLLLDQSELTGFPGSMSYTAIESTKGSLTLNAAKGDQVNVVYELLAQIETKGSFFSSAKKYLAQEEVDLPRYNVPLLAKSVRADTTTFISGVSEGLDYRVTVSRGSFSLGQVVTFTVHHCQTVDPKLVIVKLITRIRQDTIILAQGKTKTISTYLSLGAGKFYPEPVKTAAAGRVSWVGSATASIEGVHEKEKKKLAAAVDAFSSSVSEVNVGGMYEVKHFAELCVVLKDDRRLLFDVGVEFEAVDEETKEWLIMHTPRIARED